MAATPKLKCFNADGEYVAACKYGEEAACIMSMNGDGSVVKYGHRHVVWREGQEAQPAGESYDFVAQTINDRIAALRQAA